VKGVNTSKVTATKPTNKPNKPYPDFPLFAHATRRWAKKIRGKLHYFGPWDDADGALNRYVAERDDLYAGRKPRVKTDGTTIRDLCNRFLTSKTHLRDTGEITPRTFSDYQRVAARSYVLYAAQLVCLYCSHMASQRSDLT
jgi:hypothetical protein